MTATTRIHIVRRRETLSLIARRYGVGMRALARRNGIVNVNLIFVGQRLALPSTAPRPVMPRPTVSGGGTTQVAGGVLRLSATDVLNIKKTVKTEWVPSAGADQAYGIIDTILNRVVSGRWGPTVAHVVNAPQQFSDINGPVAHRDNRTSVEQIPASAVSRQVNQLVDGYLVERAAGRPSIIGSHLNYANPHYSSRRNLSWIMVLNGPKLGRNNNIHYHGTTAGLQRYRPRPYAIVLPGMPASPADPGPARAERPPMHGRRLNGNSAAAANGIQVKSGGVRIGQLDPAMEPVFRAVATAARELGLPTPVITSGNDSRHGRGSLHFADRALDFRGNNITVAQGRAFQNAVRQALGGRYDVLFEDFPRNPTNNHLHVEFDPD